MFEVSRVHVEVYGDTYKNGYANIWKRSYNSVFGLGPAKHVFESQCHELRVRDTRGYCSGRQAVMRNDDGEAGGFPGT